MSESCRYLPQSLHCDNYSHPRVSFLLFKKLFCQK